VAARKSGWEKLGEARGAEDGARESWVSAYDANAGSIRTIFPRNRKRQDLYFEDFRDKTVAESDDDGEPKPPTQ